MDNSKSRIVILEDEVSLAKAMSEAFTREGFEVYSSGRTDEVMEYMRTHKVKTIFVDCLLPGGSGVDFVAELRRTYDPNMLEVVLMSGLFTDNSFVKDSIRSTQAVAFLKKPFELKEALDILKKKAIAEASKEVISPRKSLYQLFSKSMVGVREKRKAIEALEEIHGFDLPYLYSLLAETKSSGHLNIANHNGDVSGISFSQGNIVVVDISDRETFLGKLLIEGGFITNEDLEPSLNIMSTKRLGERLISENLLSPHAFQIALANQMSIRLSRSIVNAPMKVNFVATEVELTKPNIEKEHLTSFIHDWIASKIDHEWLKAFYTQWGDYVPDKSSLYSADAAVLRLPLISNFPGVFEHLTSGQSLNSILESRQFPEETTLQALHLLLTKGQIVFAKKTSFATDEERTVYFKKVWSQFEGKNKLEAFDLLTRITNTDDSAPDAILSEFKRMLGDLPDPATQKNLYVLYNKIFESAGQAVEFAKTGNRDKLKEQIAQSEIEMKIKAAGLFEEAKAELTKSLFAKALVNLQKAIAIDPKLEKIKLYLTWAKLGVSAKEAAKANLLKEIEIDLMQVPPEDKFDALYSFVLGMFYKAKGDVVLARKAFEKSLNLDSSFMMAKRELSMLMMSSGGSKDQSKDLKDLVAGFFKKR